MFSKSSHFFIKRILITVSIFLCIPGLLNAADTLSVFNDLQLGGYLKYGTLMPHHSSIKYTLESNLTACEVNFTTKTYGRSPWDKLYRYPKYGLGYHFTTLGNKNIYGNAHALILFMDIPFYTSSKRFGMNYQIGIGLAYLTKSFDIVENPLNMAISSGPNAYINLKFNARYQVVKSGELAAGIGFSHFSNGKMGTPNQGLNGMHLALGYYHRIKNYPEKEKIVREFPTLKKNEWEVTLSTGTKRDDQASENAYLITSLVVDYRRNPGPKYGFGMGCDFFYDEALGPNKIASVSDDYTTRDLLQFGMHSGIYARYGKLRVVGNVGTYIFARYYKYARVYTRIGLRYSFTDHFYFNFTLKAHYAIADYIEWGIGYRL